MIISKNCTTTVDLTEDEVCNPKVARMHLSISIRPFRDSDNLIICSWVNSFEEMQRISSDDASSLTPDILQRWVDDSVDALVVQLDNKPAAFCTTSIAEYDLPNDSIEACHLITIPAHRRKYFATALLNFTRLVAAQRSYDKLVGRIVPRNMPGLQLANYIRWKEISDSSQLFNSEWRWFCYELRK